MRDVTSIVIFASAVLVTLWGYAPSIFNNSSEPEHGTAASPPRYATSAFPFVHAPLIPTLETRHDLALLCESEGLQLGVGVGAGGEEGMMRRFLKLWPSSRQFAMVYFPLPQAEGSAAQQAVSNDVLDSTDEEILQKFPQFREKLLICRNESTICASRFPDEYFDIAFLDNRYDYNGVMEDLNAWWPKVRVGGIVAGHDYVSRDELAQMWAYPLPVPVVNAADGTTRNDGSVRAGVNEFFMTGDLRTNPHYRQVVVAIGEAEFHTWIVRK